MAYRILLVARPAVGGMAAHIRTLCTKLDGSRFAITLACPPDAALPAQVAHLPLPIADGISPRCDLWVLMRLRRLLGAGGYDLVHVHGLKAALLAALACRRRGSPPLVVTLHNSLPAQRPGIRGCWRERALRAVLRPATRVVVVSQAQYQDVSQRGLVATENVTHIPNGICLSPAVETALPPRHKIREQLKLPEHSCVILMVSRLFIPKGIGDLLLAAKELADRTELRYLIAGDGPDAVQLQEQARCLGLANRVVFLGYRNDVPALMRAADIFVLPSWQEGLPLSILEAMAARLPVIATAVGGIPELVQDGHNGILVPVREPHALAAAILKLVCEPGLRSAMGAAGYQRVKERYDEALMLERISAVYSEVLSRA